MAYYRDLREYLGALEARGKLVRVARPINKDTHLHPLVRWQFRGLPEGERKAFFFENVVDARGRRYDVPVVVGCYASSRDIYALGMGCSSDQIAERWDQAQLATIEPEVVSEGPVQEVVHSCPRLRGTGILWVCGGRTKRNGLGWLWRETTVELAKG